MLFFLRNIRRKLMKENKITTYVLYAVGEVLLVVVGILIAVRIDDWTNEKQRIVKERIYLEGIKEDLLKNREDLENDIQDNIGLIHNVDSIIHLSKTQEYKNWEDPRLSFLLYKLGEYTLFEVYDGTFNEIMSSGSLNTISNSTIRKAIVSWEASLIEMREIERFVKDNHSFYIEILNKNIFFYDRERFGQFKSEKAKKYVFEDVLLMNKVYERTFLADWLNREYEEKKNEIDELIEIIDNELDKSK